MIGIYLSFVLTFKISSLVLSQPDLCRNPRLDSIAWMSDSNQYFFTSGGWYWIVKENEFPPPVANAKPLPNGFQKGEAAVYRNTLDSCKSISGANSDLGVSEKEIFISEKTSNGHKFMIFDVRNNAWKEPFDRSSDNCIGRAQIKDWESSLEAMFEYKTFEIYVVQADTYAAIDFSKLCKEKGGFAQPFPPQPKDNFQLQRTIDAMTYKAEEKTLYVFYGNQFYGMKVQESNSKDGKFIGTKGSTKSIKKDFFKYNDECPEALVNPDKDKEVVPGQGNSSTDGRDSSGSKSGTIFIVIGVIVICLVVASVGVVAFVFMSKKKEANAPIKNTETNKAQSSPKVAQNLTIQSEKSVKSKIAAEGPKPTRGQTTANKK